MIKASINQKDRISPSVCIPNNRPRKTWRNDKAKRRNRQICVYRGDFNAPFSATARTTEQKI